PPPRLTPFPYTTLFRSKPNLLLREVVQGMPRGATQEVRVLTATFQPGDQTVFHTHRSPVTVYVLEGEFTLELEGRPPVTVRAGQDRKSTRLNSSHSQIS